VGDTLLARNTANHGANMLRSLALSSFVLLAMVGFAPDPAAVKVQGPDTIGNVVYCNILATGPAGFPQVAFTSSASAGNASNVATLPGAVAKTTFITGFTATAAGSTAALDVTITVTGTISGTLNYTFTFPVGALTAAQPLVVSFNPAIPASGTNTAIVVTLPAGGAGNTNASIAAYGFQQ